MAKEKKSLLERIDPGVPREKTIEWPFAVAGEAPKITLRVLSAKTHAEAHHDAKAHFKSTKQRPDLGSEEFLHRERAEILERAIVDEDGDPVGSADQWMEQPQRILNGLFSEWSSHQSSVSPFKFTAAELEGLIDELKKNFRSEVLVGCSSSLLIALIGTLVGRFPSSTTESGSGS